SLGAVSESLKYLHEIVKKQRESPGDGLLGMIVKEYGDKVDDWKMAGMADGLLTSGLESKGRMVTLDSFVLLRDPESFALVHDDDSAVDGVVEEMLRYLTVVQVAFPRFAREDVEVGGKKIASGDIVLVSLSGADRDGSLGDDTESFEATREKSAHLAFGHGVHRCIGAELGRMELRAAYPAGSEE